MPKFVRTCQECGHVQSDVQPQGDPTDAYRNRKCKKCKSAGLDYGRLDRSEDPPIEVNYEVRPVCTYHGIVVTSRSIQPHIFKAVYSDASTAEVVAERLVEDMTMDILRINFYLAKGPFFISLNWTDDQKEVGAHYIHVDHDPTQPLVEAVRVVL